MRCEDDSLGVANYGPKAGRQKDLPLAPIFKLNRKKVFYED